MSGVIDPNGKRGLVVGVANEASIAAGCARAFRAAGTELALTCLNDKASPWVEPVAREVGATMLLPCEATAPDERIGHLCRQRLSHHGVTVCRDRMVLAREPF